MATDIGKLTSLEHNLKNLDVSHITGAVQKELFDIVGGGAIDVDPYVLRAVENLENVSDVEQRIKNLRDDLKSKSEEEIPYSTPKKITNTKVELGDTTSTPPMVDLTNLDTKITEQKNALSDLSNIQQKIQQVKNRLEDNKGKCETLLGEYTKYSSKLDDLVTLENDISTHNRYKTLLEKCNTCITRISDIENAYHFNPTNWNSNVRLLNSIIGRINSGGFGVTLTGITTRGDYTTCFSEVQLELTKCNDDLSKANDEKRSRIIVDRTLSSFNPTEINIPYRDHFNLSDSDTKVDASTLTDEGSTKSKRDAIISQLADLETLKNTLPTLKKRYESNIQKLEEIKKLNDFREELNRLYPNSLEERNKEFSAIKNISKTQFNISDATYNPQACVNPTLRFGTVSDSSLNFPSGKFEIVDKDGKNLLSGKDLKIKQGGEEITISGVSFIAGTAPTAPQLHFDADFSVSPMDKAKFPLSEEIFIKCTIEDPTTHVKVSHKKPFKLTIESPQLSSTDREAAYDDLNSGNAINNIIENYYTDQDRKKKEDDLIFKILSVLPDQKAVEEVKNNSERKKLFLEQVRNGITGYSVDLAKLKRSFKTKLCDEKRKVPAQYLQSQKTFKDYLRADLHGYYEEIATSTIKAHLETKKDDIIKSFLDFQNQTIEHLKDSGYNSNFMEFLGENKKNLTPHERTTRWSRRFGRDYSNWSQVFKCKGCDLPSESVDLEGGPYKYSMKVHCYGVNDFSAQVNKGGKSITLHGSNPYEIVTGFINLAYIGSDLEREALPNKARYSMALSFLKGLVKMAESLNFNLERQITSEKFKISKPSESRGTEKNIDRITTGVVGDKLVLKGAYVDKTTRQLSTTTLFDEAKFKALHDDTALEHGIYSLLGHLNGVLDANAKEYQKSVHSISKMKYDYSTVTDWIQLGPVKRLFGRLFRGKTNYNFDFQTRVTKKDSGNHAFNPVDITFKDGIFYLVTKYQGKDYTFKGKNLGDLLRKGADGRKDKQRIFDGMELSILEAVNRQFFERLRTNNMMNGYSYVITDNETYFGKMNKTGRTYIMDHNGHLGYLPIEDKDKNPLNAYEDGVLKSGIIPAMIPCSAQETSQFFQNPFLANKLFRMMKNQLHYNLPF